MAIKDEEIKVGARVRVTGPWAHGNGSAMGKVCTIVWRGPGDEAKLCQRQNESVRLRDDAGMESEGDVTYLMDRAVLAEPAEKRDWKDWLPPKQLPDTGRKDLQVGQVIAVATSDSVGVVRSVRRITEASSVTGRAVYEELTQDYRSTMTMDSVSARCSVLVQDVGQAEPTPPEVLYGAPALKVSVGQVWDFRYSDPKQSGHVKLIKVNGNYLQWAHVDDPLHVNGMLLDQFLRWAKFVSDVDPTIKAPEVKVSTVSKAPPPERATYASLMAAERERDGVAYCKVCKAADGVGGTVISKMGATAGYCFTCASTNVAYKSKLNGTIRENFLLKKKPEPFVAKVDDFDLLPDIAPPRVKG